MHQESFLRETRQYRVARWVYAFKVGVQIPRGMHTTAQSSNRVFNVPNAATIPTVRLNAQRLPMMSTSNPHTKAPTVSPAEKTAEKRVSRTLREERVRRQGEEIESGTSVRGGVHDKIEDRPEKMSP